MILTAAPYRISLFGGGTDYPVWFQKHGGAVLSTTINRYCYIQCRYLPPFFDHRHRIVWSKIETADEINQIEHPAVRACLNHMKIDRGVEIHHTGDLPARTGIGSSSSFAVSLILALSALQKTSIAKKELSKKAIHLEQTLLSETVGCQDQIAAAYGGLNLITFQKSGEFDVTRVKVRPGLYHNLFDHMVLMYTGVARNASEIAAKQIQSIEKKPEVLEEILLLVNEAAEILTTEAATLDRFGQLLHESWLLKRSINPAIANERVDDLYAHARESGALGGKLLGAGGGGFMLFLVPPGLQGQFKEGFKNFLFVSPKGEDKGAHVVYSSGETGDTPRS